MLEQIRKIDSWIIDNVFQRICNKVWNYWPISCFTLSKMCLTLNLSLLVMANPKLSMFLFGFFILCVNLTIIFNLEKISKPNFMNEFRYQFWIIRIVSTCYSIILMAAPPYGIKIDLALFFNICTQYFLACQMLPPKRRKEYFSFKSLILKVQHG